MQETLKNEALKVQTQELATAVVQTILNDPAIALHASAFLAEATKAPLTQEALVQLTVHVLQHEDTLRAAQLLATKLVALLAQDKVRGIYY
ncbi:hypothetical protein EON64_12845 [archaeon]|nr:MAG: hypothetical protein EON64_12845 [archaeon]